MTLPAHLKAAVKSAPGPSGKTELSWLMRTTYISNDSTERAKAERQAQEEAPADTRETQMEAIQVCLNPRPMTDLCPTVDTMTPVPGVLVDIASFNQHNSLRISLSTCIRPLQACEHLRAAACCCKYIQCCTCHLTIVPVCQRAVLSTCRVSWLTWLLQCEPVHTANGNLALFAQLSTSCAASGKFGPGRKSDCGSEFTAQGCQVSVFEKGVCPCRQALRLLSSRLFTRQSQA